MYYFDVKKGWSGIKLNNDIVKDKNIWIGRV